MDPDPYWSPTSYSGSGSEKNEYGSTTLVGATILGQQEMVRYLRRVAGWREDAAARQVGGGSYHTWAARNGTVPEKGSWLKGGRGGTTGGGWELRHLGSKERYGTREGQLDGGRTRGAQQVGGGSSGTWAARNGTVPEKGSWMEGGRSSTTGGGVGAPALGQQETVRYLRRAAGWREDAGARQVEGGSSRTWTARRCIPCACISCTAHTGNLPSKKSWSVKQLTDR